MTPNNIANIRIVSQQIAETEFRTAKELVTWMGAMQAQDLLNPFSQDCQKKDQFKKNLK